MDMKKKFAKLFSEKPIITWSPTLGEDDNGDYNVILPDGIIDEEMYDRKVLEGVLPPALEYSDDDDAPLYDSWDEVGTIEMLELGLECYEDDLRWNKERLEEGYITAAQEALPKNPIVNPTVLKAPFPTFDDRYNPEDFKFWVALDGDDIRHLKIFCEENDIVFDDSEPESVSEILKMVYMNK